MERAKSITIGLTGPTGAGKSSLRALLADYRCELIDCDILARQVTDIGSPALAELAQEFGSDIIAADGSLIRPLLAQRAFSSKEGSERLGAITHPRIRELTVRSITAAHDGGFHAAVDAPLLFESGFDSLCDVTIAVIAPSELRLSRIMARDGISREAALVRMQAQPDDDYYIARADYILHNDGSLSAFMDSARALLERIFCAAEVELYE